MAGRLAARRLAATAQEDVTGVDGADRHAGIGSRAFAFVLDSVVLFAFALLFATVSFLNIYLGTHSGRDNPSDQTITISVAILMASVPAWLFLNLVLSLKRGQSVGQYVAGLQVVKEDGASPGLLRTLVYWLALHPLLFHPLLAFFWVLLAYVALSLSENTALVIGSLAVGLICFFAPPIAFFTALGDRGRRALHDRIAGVTVVRLE